MQKTAYEVRISDWSSDVCSSDLGVGVQVEQGVGLAVEVEHDHPAVDARVARQRQHGGRAQARGGIALRNMQHRRHRDGVEQGGDVARSEEHTSELQSLMRISYAVFCLKKTKTKKDSHYEETM